MESWGTIAVVVAAVAAVTAPGCGGDDESGGEDGGGPLDAGADASAVVDSGTDGGMDGGEATDGGDVADAGADAAATDGGGDAGPDPVFQLFAFVGGDLVEVDPATGEQTTVGSTVLGPITRAAFDPTTGALFGIYGNTTLPKLVTVDVCTGTATDAATLTIPGNFVDGFDVDATTGTLFAAVSNDGSHPADANAEHLVTLDPETGTSTSLGDFVGIADADRLFVNSTPPLVGNGDPTEPPTLVLYDLDVSTRTASAMRSASPRAARLAFHEGTLYGIGASGAIDGQLVAVDPATGEATAIGGSFTANDVGALVSAHACP